MIFFYLHGCTSEDVSYPVGKITAAVASLCEAIPFFWVSFPVLMYDQPLAPQVKWFLIRICLSVVLKERKAASNMITISISAGNVRVTSPKR